MKGRPIPRDPSGILILFLLVLIIAWAGTKSRTKIVNRGMRSGEEIRSENLSAFQKVTLGKPIMINAASEQDLQAIPGIGPKLAHEIILKRERTGRFLHMEDLVSVPGIGPKLFESIKKYITIQEPLAEKE